MAAPIENAISQSSDLLRVVIVGHVDHGKSTLVGRLVHDTGSLPEGKLEAIQAMCERRGMPFEWAFLMDAFQSERDQGITIDTSQIWFRTQKRGYTIIDAPGHREFIKNMITGASSADAALMLIDASQGIQQQSRLHAFLLSLLGIRQIVVVVNKMDLVGYDQAQFAEIERIYTSYLAELGVVPGFVIPVSARDGDNIAAGSVHMDWYRGPGVVAALDAFQTPPADTELPLRLPIQDVYKFDERRILAGRISSGRLRVGDRLVFSPSNKTARIASIETWQAPPRDGAGAGDAVGITLDEQIFVERGEMASDESRPPIESNVFCARIFWLGRKPLKAGDAYRLRLQTREVPVTVEAVTRLYDADNLSQNDTGLGEAVQVERNGIADIVLRSPAMLALDEADAIESTGRLVLTDGTNILAGGRVFMNGFADQRPRLSAQGSNLTAVAHRIRHKQRAERNGHRGGVLWFTGLSGAGKSTLAMALEHELFRRGYQVYALDGDNVRGGLNANLGFSPEDRAENIRRVGEVAALFADAGNIVVTAFISPYRSDRDRARAAVGEGFHEIFIDAGLAVCESRDPKGLYRKARAGEIGEFTGITAPYEIPASPELRVDTGNQSIEASMETLLRYVEANFRQSKRIG